MLQIEGSRITQGLGKRFKLFLNGRGSNPEIVRNAQGILAFAPLLGLDLEQLRVCSGLGREE